MLHFYIPVDAAISLSLSSSSVMLSASQSVHCLFTSVNMCHIAQHAFKYALHLFDGAQPGVLSKGEESQKQHIVWTSFICKWATDIINP